MALRVRRINSFLELWCLVASGGLDIWVSSTSFQKSNIGWPHQPSKEKFLKINIICHHSTKKTFFQNINLQFFTDISTFSVRGCWDQLMLLFWKLIDETQMPTTHEATRHHGYSSIPQSHLESHVLIWYTLDSVISLT